MSVLSFPLTNAFEGKGKKKRILIDKSLDVAVFHYFGMILTLQFG